jgi:hypothetical protein
MSNYAYQGDGLPWAAHGFLAPARRPRHQAAGFAGGIRLDPSVNRQAKESS